MFLPFIADDALISLRYSERAAQGLGLTWTTGERTEGYTNLLWVLLNVPAFWRPIDPLRWTRALGRWGMALAVAGLVARGETLIDDTACVATSYPSFVETVNALAGADAITVEA